VEARRAESGKPPSIYIDNRQRVNLSEFARLTITSDLLDFEGKKPTLSRAINLVFLAYSKYAVHDHRTVQKYCSIKPMTHVKEVPRLQNRVVELLVRQSGIIAEAYGGSVGKYVKSVIEQYAALSYSERVKVYFAKTIKELEAAIRNQESVLIQTPEAHYSVRPYRIASDKITAHNYLVGYAKTADGSQATAAFRLTRILRVENDGEPGSLTESEIDYIKGAIEERGVPFLGSEPQTIRVRLSEIGEQLYSKLVHNRPIYDSRDGDTFTFYCTVTQADYYFFKFGAAAEVLEPLQLREEFKSRYRKAAEAYS
jgi:hypothetical protein